MDPLSFVKIGESIASLSFIDGAEQKRKREEEDDLITFRWLNGGVLTLPLSLPSNTKGRDFYEKFFNYFRNEDRNIIFLANREIITKIEENQTIKEIFNGASIVHVRSNTGFHESSPRVQLVENGCIKSQTRIEPTEDTKEVLEMFCEPNNDESYCCYNSEAMCDFSTTPECPIFYDEIDRKDPLSFFTAYPSRHKFSLEVFQENGQDVNPMERMPNNPLTREEVEYWYKGSYRHGVPHTSKLYPIGKAWYKNGNTYEGEFVYGKKEGKGTYTWPDGGKYDGYWKDNEMYGEGIMTYPNESIYKGDWKDGKKDGKGILTYPDGRNYEGDWKDDEKEGKGVFTWPNGFKLDGYWKNGIFRDGKAILTSPDGRKYEYVVERR